MSSIFITVHKVSNLRFITLPGLSCFSTPRTFVSRKSTTVDSCSSFGITLASSLPKLSRGYSLIGMPTLASLLKEAASVLGTQYPRERNDRKGALLIASGRSQRELKQIFKKQENLYLAFAEATKGLPFDSLDKQFWQAVKTENGGF